MSLSNKIRKLLIDKDITLTQMAAIIGKKKKKNFSVQNLSQKLKNNRLNLQEFEIILNTLGLNLQELEIILNTLDYNIVFRASK